MMLQFVDQIICEQQNKIRIITFDSLLPDYKNIKDLSVGRAIMTITICHSHHPNFLKSNLVNQLPRCYPSFYLNRH